MADEIERTDAEKQKIKALFKQMHLFKGVGEADLEKIIGKMVTRNVATDERIFAEGEFAESFFVVLQGHVQITRVINKDERVLVANMVRGDYFGEFALLQRTLRTGEARAKVPTTILEMTLKDFQWMLQTYPLVQKDLNRIVSGYELARRKQFKWLREDETIHVLARRDYAILALHLLTPVLVLLLGLGAFALAPRIQASLLDFLGWIAVTVALGMGLWLYVDWENDYYVVTDKRVVYVEKIVLLYDSIQEAPLETIQTIRLSSANFVERLFGFGNVQVDTYGGQILMKQVRDPARIEQALNEYWDRAKTHIRQSDSDKIKKEVRQRLGLEAAPKPAAAGAAASKAPVKKSLLEGFLEVRVVEGDVITYRRHWFIFLVKIWPLLLTVAVLLVFALAGFFGLPVFFTGAQYLLGIVLLVVGSSPIWIYQYLDWRDDRYQLTNREVIDFDKKPFLEEKKRVAPLDHILSISHDRKGLIALILNFGTVDINAGNESLSFNDVYNPARVQSEISEASFRYKNNKKANEERSNREHIEKLVDIYAENLPEYIEKKRREAAQNAAQNEG
ncbi:MAG: cyclic nucleotide-binding domain-containing protein [Anaerolineales bacterium]|nr:cyclic nucleotide-binding domain-containing protein [Anaerolineales bacterium]